MQSCSTCCSARGQNPSPNWANGSDFRPQPAIAASARWRIAPDTIGLGLDVFVDISLTSQSEEALTAFESAVKSFDEILECQLLSGASDYRLRVAARNVADFDRLHRHCLSRLPGVAAMHSAFALRTIKGFEGYPVQPTERR